MKRNRSRPTFAGCGVAVFFLTACSFAVPAPQSGKPAAPAKPPRPLAEEQAQILRDRELLENLELLSNFEQIQYFELFNENGKTPAPVVNTPGAKAGKKDEAGKNGKKKN